MHEYGNGVLGMSRGGHVELVTHSSRRGMQMECHANSLARDVSATEVQPLACRWRTWLLGFLVDPIGLRHSPERLDRRPHTVRCGEGMVAILQLETTMW